MEKGSDISPKKFNPKIYFIVGWIFLMAMALCWSIDNSIVLILASAATYFIFLGFYAISRGIRWGNWEKSQSFRTDPSATSVSDVLKNIFSKTTTSGSFHTKTSGRPVTDFTNRRVAPMIFLAVFGMFFIFIMAIIFSSSNVSSEMGDYYNRAESQYVQGDYDSAYINYRRAWRLDESNAEAMVGYGNVLVIRNQHDSAAVMYDRAFEINPQYLNAAYAKGAMYYNLERYSECIAVMDPVLRENPEYYDGMLLVGDCYYSLKQYDDALVWYENAYENGGSRSSALCHIMAYIYDTKGDYEKAINFYREALEYDSTIVSIYKRLGELIPNEEGNYYRTQAVRLGEGITNNE